MPIVYLNGRFLDRERAAIPLDDRGFLFGDGVYEVCRIVRGRIFQAEAHWNRLARSLSEVAIDAGEHLDLARMADLFVELVQRNALAHGEATVYLQVTRGAAPRTHAFPPPGTLPTVFASAAAFEPPRRLREEGAAAITLPDLRWARCDIKSINLLPNVLGKQRAFEAGAFEAIFLREGMVTEGASTNIFAVVGGELRTHPLSTRILPGITREIVLGLARELGIPHAERPVTAEELPHAEELFATGTTTDVQPLVRLDDRPVADGRVGEVTRALQLELRRLLDARR